MKYAMIFGANSYEHEISIVSAVTVAKLLDDVIFIYISFDNEFYLIDKNNMNANYFAKGSYKSLKPLILQKGGFFVKKMLGFEKINFDVAINIVHGKDGEDGKIASLFDFYNISYIGPRTTACVLSFDKHLTKIYAAEVGVKTIPYKLLKSKNDEVELPIILKPARLGSSIGINIVKNKEDFAYAYDSSIEFDEKVLAEPFIENIKEVNLAGFFDGEKIIYSKIEEPKKDGHLDFDQKYLSFKQEKIEEVVLNDEIVNKLKTAFANLYMPLFKGALIRCDFFIKDNEVYLNEINPNPGSYANYLFDDFKTCLEKLAKAVEKEPKIKENFAFLNKIVRAK